MSTTKGQIGHADEFTWQLTYTTGYSRTTAGDLFSAGTNVPPAGTLGRVFNRDLMALVFNDNFPDIKMNSSKSIQGVAKFCTILVAQFMICPILAAGCG